MDDQQQAAAATVIKRGETAIQTTLQRSHVGLTMTVKAHPRVEDLIRNLSGSEYGDVRTMGRYWIPVATGQILNVWKFTENIGHVKLDTGAHFTLDRPGQPLVIGDPDSPLLNLSFLRLVGISEGAGVSFGLKGVFTLGEVREAAKGIENALRQFYISYIRPINLTVIVSTQEL